MMPESPRFLVKVGKVDEARTVLARLRADGDETDERVLGELEDIVAVVRLEKQTADRNSYWAMFWGISASLILFNRLQ